MRQRIEMLQKVKDELENAQNEVDEPMAVNNDKNSQDDSDETLESLLRKLASASIEDIKASDFNVGKNQLQLVEVPHDLELVQTEDENTDVNIRESILVTFRQIYLIFSKQNSM